MVAYVLCVGLHVIAAAVWLGSMVFFAIAIAPVLRRPEYRGSLASAVTAIGRRYRALAWTSLAILLATGTGNLALRGLGWADLSSGAFWRTGFGTTLSHKLMAVAAVVAFTAAHEATVDRRRLASWFARVTMALSVIVVILAVALARGVAW